MYTYNKQEMIDELRAITNAFNNLTELLADCEMDYHEDSLRSRYLGNGVNAIDDIWKLVEHTVIDYIELEEDFNGFNWGW